MKKFFIFIAIAMVFIMLTSGLAIGRKAADKDPEETGGIITIKPATTEVPVIEDSVFYIDGHAVQDPTDESLNGKIGYFTLDGTAYFGVLVNEDENYGGTIFLTNEKQEYRGVPFVVRGTDDFKTVNTPEVHSEFPHEFNVGHLAPNFDHYDSSGEIWFVIIFLDLPADEQNNFEVCKDLGSYDFMFEYSPGEIEGPSAGDDTQPETPPQIDPWMPEGPGAE